MYKKKFSLKKKIIIPLIILIIVQNLIFLLTTVVTGVFDKLDSESYRILNERVRARSDELNKLINKITINTQSTSKNLGLQIQELYKDYNIIDKNIVQEITDKIIMAGTNHIIDLTTKGNITGAFFILNNSNIDNIYDGVYIRDLSSEVTLDNNSDLLIEVGSKELSNKLNITLDVQWNSKYNFSEEYNKANEYFDDSFYKKPYYAALKYKSTENLGYWAKPFKLNSEDDMIITYSAPIIIDGGKPIGVLGIELSEEFISKLISAKELLYSDGFYVIGEIEDGILNTDWFISNGIAAKHVLSKDKNEIRFKTTNNNNNEKMIATVWNLDIYNRNTVYKANNLALAGVVPETALQNSSNNLRYTLFISTSMTLVIGIIIIILVSNHITKPIEKLANEVKQFDPDNQIFFSRTNILEMDYLIDALENLNEGIINSSARMSKIIKAIGLPIGCFEVNWEKDRVFLTDSLFDILEIEKDFPDQKFISLDKWYDITEIFLENIVFDLPNCYKWQGSNSSIRWLSMKFINEDEKSVGIIIDISEDILRKQRLEYERDHDTLTQLLNRKALTEKAQEIILKKPNKIGLLIFADLDHLKYINDTYGHSYGDKYIKLAANMFNEFSLFNGIIARISGDEFVIYLHGYDSREELLNIVNNVLNLTSNADISLPNNVSQKISASKGMAWYPKDSESIIELIKYADFAMYEVKKSVRGGLKEFDINLYNKEKNIN